MDDKDKSNIESFLYKECGKSLDLGPKQRHSFSLFHFGGNKEKSSSNLANTKKYAEALQAELEEWDTLLYGAKDDITKAKDKKTVVREDILSTTQREYFEQNLLQKYLDGLPKFNEEVEQFLNKFSDTFEIYNQSVNFQALKLRFDTDDLLDK